VKQDTEELGTAMYEKRRGLDVVENRGHRERNIEEVDASKQRPPDVESNEQHHNNATILMGRIREGLEENRIACDMPSQIGQHNTCLK
jgi:hypothetical protein